MKLRDASVRDLDAVLALNRQWEHFLSPLDASRLASLHEQADQHRLAITGDGKIAAFLLAFREGSGYDSVNYQWFAARRDRFFYIDRVVVAGAWQGQGLGRRLYEDIFDRALASGIEHVCCEFDLKPPNPRSRAFHESFGFEEVGTQAYGDVGKRVSLRELRIAPVAPRPV